jgi:hypothetical protein
MCVREGEELIEEASAGLKRDDARPGDFHLLYYGKAKVNVRGPVTGRLYEFSLQAPLQTVDPRDAVSMLKTRLFRRIR